MTFIGKQITDVLIKATLEEGEVFDPDGFLAVSEDLWYDIEAYADDVKKVEPSITTFEKVEEFGGEGKGDEQWVVFRVNDQLFRKEGYYSSYDGGEWDGDIEEVEPYDVVVTKYREVKR